MNEPVLVWQELLGMHYATHNGTIYRIHLTSLPEEGYSVELRKWDGKKFKFVEGSSYAFVSGEIRDSETWMRGVIDDDDAEFRAIADMKKFAELFVAHQWSVSPIP